MPSQSNTWLKAVLLFDAATCLLMGVLFVTAFKFVSGITDIPQPLLYYAGLLLLPIGLFMAATALWWPRSSGAVWLIIAGNAGWVIASLAVLAVIAANGLSSALILIQAIVVAVLAWVEHRALRTSRSVIA
jgi:hypothetical protein